MLTVFLGSCFSLLSKMQRLESRFSLSPAHPVCPVKLGSNPSFTSYVLVPHTRRYQSLASPAPPGHFPACLPVTPAPLWVFCRSLTCYPPGFSNLFAVPSPAPRLSRDLASPICLKGPHFATPSPQVAHHLLSGTLDLCPTSSSVRDTPLSLSLTLEMMISAIPRCHLHSRLPSTFPPF